MSQNPGDARLVALSFLACLAVLAGCAPAKPEPHFQGTAIEPAVAAPDFTLEDQYGHPWTLSSQHGRTVALMFGYTHCTDTCPLMMAKLGDAARRTKGPVTIAFVTVDPQRDTAPALQRYLKPFQQGVSVAGLTGPAPQIQDAMRSYHIWVQKIPGRHGNDDYDDAHSDAIYLIDKDGNERVVHSSTSSVASIASDMGALQ
jgi:protein SCO1/2